MNGWIAGAIVVGLIWLIASTSNKEAPTASVPYSTPAPAYSPGVAGPLSPLTASSEGEASNEQKPPIGTNIVLNSDQIRYCLAEKISIKAVEGVVKETSEQEIDTFNARVSDYNARCGAYRYRRGEVEQVGRKLELERDRIETTAKTAWIRKSLGLSNSPPSRGKRAERASDDALASNEKKAAPSGGFVPLPGTPKTYVPTAAPTQVTPSIQTGSTSRSFMPANAEIDYTGHGWM